MTERGVVRRILARAAANTEELRPQDVCQACVKGLDVQGAALTLIATIGETRMGPTLASSDPVAARLEELQFTLGEGPALQAYETGEPVLVEDLQQVPYTPWPMFTEAVRDHLSGVGALFVFPLQLGAVRLGTLSLYRTEAGRIGAEVLGEALLAAEAVTLTMSGYLMADPPNTVADRWFEQASDRRVVVYQATGMLMQQLGVGVSEAFVRLRARAFADDRPVADLAQEVLDGKLHLNNNSSPEE
ncbi:GAF and ANTAR domain-containing protein [Nonomuraea sp. NPDC050556]|uniref:GAF and ANTAR domain-containing protein n=1 Tax=Nonomuraea sp. NPDC050556 TaxID=3364369 RepID=UPI0037912735